MLTSLYWVLTACQEPDKEPLPPEEPSEPEPSDDCEQEEIPYDGFDQDCDGSDLTDVDEDGYEAQEVGGPDCDDSSGAIHPGVPDAAGDDLDEDCDGVDGVDGDGDGQASLESGGLDCDDAEPAIYAGALEIWYDGVDQDCDGACDYDQDGDGAVLAGTEVVDGSACDAIPQPYFAAAFEDCDELDPLAANQRAGTRSPELDELDVPLDVRVSATLFEPDPAAVLELAGPDGPVAGALLVDGAEVSLQPAGPLLGETEYEVRLTTACGVESWSFRTELPRQPVAPEALVGRVWEIDLGSGTWTQVPDTLLEPYLSHTLLMQVESATETEVQLLLAPGQAGAQDLCLPSTSAGGSLQDNPQLSWGPVDLELGIADVQTTLFATESVAVLAGGGELLGDMQISGVLQTAPLVEPILPGGAPDLLCGFVGCEPCPDGSQTCVTLQIEDLEAVALASPTPLVARTADEIALDPACP
jgi:hypothetical protein